MFFKFRLNYLFLILMVVFSCKKENQLEKEIAAINIDITTERFDRFAAKATLNDFAKVKQAYPFMFSKFDNDSTWVAFKSDTIQNELFREVHKTFSDFSNTEEEIELLFNHLKYYFPEFYPPKVITTTSYVDYRNKVVVSDTIAVVALDTYLGSDHKFYGGIQKFICANLKPEQIVVDMATEYAEKYMYQKQNKTLLDEMIYFGKQLYFKD